MNPAAETESGSDIQTPKTMVVTTTSGLKMADPSGCGECFACLAAGGSEAEIVARLRAHRETCGAGAGNILVAAAALGSVELAGLALGWGAGEGPLPFPDIGLNLAMDRKHHLMMGLLIRGGGDPGEALHRAMKEGLADEEGLIRVSAPDPAAMRARAAECAVMMAPKGDPTPILARLREEGADFQDAFETALYYRPEKMTIARLLGSWGGLDLDRAVQWAGSVEALSLLEELGAKDFRAATFHVGSRHGVEQWLRSRGAFDPERGLVVAVEHGSEAGVREMLALGARNVGEALAACGGEDGLSEVEVRGLLGRRAP